MREREKKKIDRKTERQRARETERQKDKKIEGQRDREKERQRDRRTHFSYQKSLVACAENKNKKCFIEKSKSSLN